LARRRARPCSCGCQRTGSRSCRDDPYVRSASSVGTPQDPGRSQPPWPALGRTTRRRVRAGPSEGIAWGRRGRTGRAMRASSAPSPHTRTWSRNPVTLSRFRVPRKAGAARRSPAVPLPRLHRDGSAAARAVRREIASAPPTVTGRHVHYLERRTHHPCQAEPPPRVLPAGASSRPQYGVSQP
jgi:hypothetical protein